MLAHSPQPRAITPRATPHLTFPDERPGCPLPQGERAQQRAPHHAGSPAPRRRSARSPPPRRMFRIATARSLRSTRPIGRGACGSHTPSLTPVRSAERRTGPWFNRARGGDKRELRRRTHSMSLCNSRTQQGVVATHRGILTGGAGRGLCAVQFLTVNSTGQCNTSRGLSAGVSKPKVSKSVFLPEADI